MTVRKRDKNKCCIGKVKYPTVKLANEALKAMKGDRNGLMRYICPYCGMYHIGHSIYEAKFLNKKKR
jgi:hypothetical protein